MNEVPLPQPSTGRDELFMALRNWVEFGQAPRRIAWCLTQVHLREQYAGGADLDAVARAHRVPADVLRPAFDAAAGRGYLHIDGERLGLADRGVIDYARLAVAWKNWIAAQLPEPDGRHPAADRLDTALDRLAARIADDTAVDRR